MTNKKPAATDKMGKLFSPNQMVLPFESLLPFSSEKDSRYPTLLTAIPLFAPINGRGKAATEHTRGIIFNTSDGQVERIGPGLDIYDEDTLIAILKLAAEKRLEGPRNAMPIKIDESTEVVNTDENNTVVYVGRVSAPQINDFLGRASGGSDLEGCRESITRLAFTRLRFINHSLNKEGITGFFDFIGDRDCKGELLIQISPAMVSLLQSYSFIDMHVRRKLSDAGKSIHRFLSGQVKDYSIRLDSLKESTGYEGSLADFKYVVMGKKGSAKTKARESQLQIMQDLGWLQSFELRGTGRKTPYELHILRK